MKLIGGRRASFSEWSKSQHPFMQRDKKVCAALYLVALRKRVFPNVREGVMLGAIPIAQALS